MRHFQTGTPDSYAEENTESEYDPAEDLRFSDDYDPGTDAGTSEYNPAASDEDRRNTEEYDPASPDIAIPEKDRRSGGEVARLD